MHLHLFKKNPNQSCPKKMTNKHANSLDALFKKARWRKHKYDINISEKKQTKTKFDLFKKLWN